MPEPQRVPHPAVDLVDHKRRRRIRLIAAERARRPQQHHDGPILVGNQMVHCIVDMGRSKPLLPDHRLAGLPPLLIIAVEEVENSRDRGAIAGYRRQARSLAVAKYCTYFLDRAAAVTIEAFVQFVRPGDQASRRGTGRLARPIYHPNEPIRLAVFYPLDTSPDIRPVRT